MPILKLAVLAVILSIASPVASSATDFSLSDNFNRQSAPVGRDWSDSPDNTPGRRLVVLNQRIQPNGVNCNVGIYRPLTLRSSDVVTLSADITPANGFGGLGNRYQTRLRIRSNGSLSSGYGISVYRGDQNYPSYVQLLLNNTVVGSSLSSFQYGDSVHLSATVYPNGSVTGYVIDNFGQTFLFQFPARDLSTLTGNKFVIEQECPDPRSSTFIFPTIDNVEVRLR